jgi:hypothetical protein
VIRQDPDKDRACLTRATLSDGTIVRSGLEDKGKKGFLATFNPAWKDFKLDENYPVACTLADASFGGDAGGKEVNGVPGAQVSCENVNSLVDLAQKKVLRFFDPGAKVGTCDLKGSDEAIRAVRACQAAQG